MKDILLIDKPSGWTSFDVVAKLRSQLRAHYRAAGLTPTKKQLRIGHAGTLDPFATGLLIVLVGEKCKEADQFLKLDKTYVFKAKLGYTSTTGDPEGELTLRSDKVPTLTEVQRVAQQFTGSITQTPPQYSAIKVNGQRAYKLARQGKTVDLPARTVEITQFKIKQYEYPYLVAECEVSSGTYIRSLVADIGTHLTTGAYCVELRRTHVGPYSLNDAVSVDSANLQAEQETN